MLQDFEVFKSTRSLYAVFGKDHVNLRLALEMAGGHESVAPVVPAPA